MASSGLGSFVAALWRAFGGRARPLLLVVGALVLGGAEVALGLTAVYALCLAFMFIAGFGAILMATSANTTIQLHVPDALRGRVLAVYTTVFVGSTPFGGLVIGWLASTAGPGFTMLVSGLSAVAWGVVALWWLRSIQGSRRSGDVARARGLGGSMAPARRR
jgi:hypothetical protein